MVKNRVKALKILVLGYLFFYSCSACGIHAIREANDSTYSVSFQVMKKSMVLNEMLVDYLLNKDYVDQKETILIVVVSDLKDSSFTRESSDDLFLDDYRGELFFTVFRVAKNDPYLCYFSRNSDSIYYTSIADRDVLVRSDEYPLEKMGSWFTATYSFNCDSGYILGSFLLDTNDSFYRIQYGKPWKLLSSY